MRARLHNQKQWLAPFSIMWTGQAISLFGSQLVQFSLIWWLTKQTGSATTLATAALVGLVPQIFLGPFVGALVDRWNRRLTMMAADSIVALATLALGFLFWTGAIQVWHVYLLLFVRAAAGTFHWPAMSASTSLMVPEEQLTRVQGLNQTLQGALNIISAPLGALLLGLLTIESILLIDVVTALVAVTSLFFIHVPQPEPQSSGAPGTPSKSSYWSDMRQGLGYVWGWPGLMMILIMATVLNFLLNPAFALLPLLVTDHFNGDALRLGILESAWGIGVVLGGILLGIWGGFKRRIVTSLAGLIVLGAGVMLLGLTPATAFVFAIGAILIVGLANPITNGPLQAIIQAAVAPEMQGRVFGLIGSATAAMTPLGLIVAGPVSDAIGIRTWYIFAGLATVAMGLLGFLIPAVMKVEENGHSQDIEEPADLAPVVLPEDQPAALPI